jgi:hypothetical protein
MNAQSWEIESIPEVPCTPISNVSRQWDSAMRIETRLRTGRSGIRARQRQEVFLFSNEFRTALGPMQPPIQSVPEFFPEEERPGRDVDQSPPSSAEVKNEWSYTASNML